MLNASLIIILQANESFFWLCFVPVINLQDKPNGKTLQERQSRSLLDMRLDMDMAKASNIDF